MKKTLLGVAGFLVLSIGSAVAQISFTGTNYTQNFDSLASSGTTNAFADNSTILGWYVVNGNSSITGTGSAFDIPATLTAESDDYAAGTGSITTGDLYSFGVLGVNALEERAFGSLGSGSPDDFFIGMRIQNDGVDAISTFTITYDGEQWRRGANNPQRAESLLVYYRIGGTSFDDTGTWTELTSLVFNSPNATLVGGSLLDGNDGANRVAGLNQSVNSLSIAPGESVWFTFVDLDHIGTDHGLAIDNVVFSATFVPEPGTAGLLALGSGLLLARRRR